MNLRVSSQLGIFTVLALGGCNAMTGIGDYVVVGDAASGDGGGPDAAQCSKTCLDPATQCGAKCTSDANACAANCTNTGCTKQCDGAAKTCRDACVKACTGCSGCLSSVCIEGVGG